MSSKHRIVTLLPLLVACVQSTHGDGPSGPPVPGGEVRVLEDRPGHGRPVLPGDRVRVELTGRYANGESWGHGPLTFVAGAASYPGAVNPPRVGSVVRMQYVVHPSDTSVRLVPFQGGDPENEAYQVRRDRGQIIVEHKVLDVCRPMKLFVMRTGLGAIEFGLGCWKIPRLVSRPVSAREAELARRIAEVNSGEPTVVPNGAIIDPPPRARERVDTTEFLGSDGLHRAVGEGRPDIVSWLIARGRDPRAADEHGFAPIHYVGFAQRPLERFVPALEQNYLDVADTLLARGAVVDVRVQSNDADAQALPYRDEEGQTALGFAGAECADRLVAHLLERGASPDAHAARGDPPIVGAARNGCPETVHLLLAHGATVELQPNGGGTPLERLISVSAFHEGHFECARLLVGAGASTAVAVQRLKERLKDPGPGGFGFSNRPQARRILALLRAGQKR